MPLSEVEDFFAPPEQPPAPDLSDVFLLKRWCVPSTLRKICHAGRFDIVRDYSPKDYWRQGILQDGQRRRDDIKHKSMGNVSRAREAVQLLIMANCDFEGDKYFWTGTFADEVTDYVEAVRRWREFVRLMRYKGHRDITYILVPEIQEGRAKRYGVRVWHFHAVIWGLAKGARERWDDCYGAWCHANGDKSNRIDFQIVRDAARLSSYIRKYLTKTTCIDVPKGRKMYLAAGRHLVRPSVERIRCGDEMPKPRGEVVYSKSYQTRFAGDVKMVHRYVERQNEADYTDADALRRLWVAPCDEAEFADFSEALTGGGGGGGGGAVDSPAVADSDDGGGRALSLENV